MSAYPKALYSKNKAGVLQSVHVKNVAEEKELSGEWVDSPAKLGFETHPAAAPGAKIMTHPEVKAAPAKAPVVAPPPAAPKPAA